MVFPADRRTNESSPGTSARVYADISPYERLRRSIVVDDRGGLRLLPVKSELVLVLELYYFSQLLASRLAVRIFVRETGQRESQDTPNRAPFTDTSRINHY